MENNETTRHLNPENCYICGLPANQHTEQAGHNFWSNAEAEVEHNKTRGSYSDVEARYVAEYRPY